MNWELGEKLGLNWEMGTGNRGWKTGIGLGIERKLGWNWELGRPDWDSTGKWELGFYWELDTENWD